MPDASGSLRVPMLSRWGERLARLKLIRRKARAEAAEQRRFSKARLFEAELILRDIIDGTDFVTDIVLDQHSWPVAGVALVVTLSAHRFKRLCEIGAELEDSEDSHDAEPGSDKEPSLGWRNASTQGGALFSDDRPTSAILTMGCGTDDDRELDDADYEPSLGSTGMIDQKRWAEGGACLMNRDGWVEGLDLELDRADAEPSQGSLTALDQEYWAAGDRLDREPSLGRRAGECVMASRATGGAK